MVTSKPGENYNKSVPYAKVNYYLDIAETVAERSTCLKKQYGAVIVKNDEIISTGYTRSSTSVELHVWL